MSHVVITYRTRDNVTWLAYQRDIVKVLADLNNHDFILAYVSYPMSLSRQCIIPSKSVETAYTVED